MADESKTSRAATLFDVRRIIGGLMLFYGVILVVLGLGDSNAEIEKAHGVHINLWAGVGMLACRGRAVLGHACEPVLLVRGSGANGARAGHLGRFRGFAGRFLRWQAVPEIFRISQGNLHIDCVGLAGCPD